DRNFKIIEFGAFGIRPRTTFFTLTTSWRKWWGILDSNQGPRHYECHAQEPRKSLVSFRNPFTERVSLHAVTCSTFLFSAFVIFVSFNSLARWIAARRSSRSTRSYLRNTA